MKKPFSIVKKLNDEVIKLNQDAKENSRIKRESNDKISYVGDVTKDNDNSSEEVKEFNAFRNNAYYNNIYSKFSNDLKGTPHPFFKSQKDNEINNTAYHPIMKRQVPIYESSVSVDDGPDSYEMDTAYNIPFEPFDDAYTDKTYPKVENPNNGFTKNTNQMPKIRNKRGIVDILQNAYMYWINNLLGMNNYKKYQPKYPKYKVINGIKYVYQPLMQMPKAKAPKELQNNIPTVIKEEGFKPIVTEDFEPSPIITADDFNKGEIVEGAVESRTTKKFQKFKDTVSEVIEDNPWQ